VGLSPCAAVDLMWFCADSCDSSAAAATVWSLGSGVYLLLQNSTDLAAAPVPTISSTSANSLPSALLSGSTSVDTAALSMWQTNSSNSTSNSNGESSSGTVVSLQQLVDRLGVEDVLYDSTAATAPQDDLLEVSLMLVTLSLCWYALPQTHDFTRLALLRSSARAANTSLASILRS
jgi:hypothetical protein